ncbi:hypothetical protein ACHAWO_001154 [Cyclotella atomus]|uniref:Chromo domain-containing protein n=1 Tax=Cyclotella atomus TaxID=382360 RepID=A0ABD3NQ25_9STRA
MVEPLYTIEKILASKTKRIRVCGVETSSYLYRVRWTGYTSADDTWEPLENVAATGHVDRFIREERALELGAKTPGAALIEYNDGETQLVDLTKETFRDASDDGKVTSKTGGKRDENDYSLICVGAEIELLWPHAGVYFPAEILYWVPLHKEANVRRVSLTSASKYRGKMLAHMNIGKESDGADLPSASASEGAVEKSREKRVHSNEKRKKHSLFGLKLKVSDYGQTSIDPTDEKISDTLDDSDSDVSPTPHGIDSILFATQGKIDLHNTTQCNQISDDAVTDAQGKKNTVREHALSVDSKVSIAASANSKCNVLTATSTEQCASNESGSSKSGVVGTSSAVSPAAAASSVPLKSQIVEAGLSSQCEVNSQPINAPNLLTNPSTQLHTANGNEEQECTQSDVPDSSLQSELSARCGSFHMSSSQDVKTGPASVEGVIYNSMDPSAASAQPASCDLPQEGTKLTSIKARAASTSQASKATASVRDEAKNEEKTSKACDNDVEMSRNAKSATDQSKYPKEQVPSKTRHDDPLDDFFLNSDDEGEAYATDLLTKESLLIENEDGLIENENDLMSREERPSSRKEKVRQPQIGVEVKSAKRSKKSRAGSKANSSATKKEPAPENSSPMFLVETILDFKINRHGVKLYKVRWAGYGPSEDTWEPLRNIGNTGHVDRYFRQKRAEQLCVDSPGAAIIEYDDGERTLVDLSQETFRCSSGDFVDSSNQESVNDYKMVFPSAKLELFWPYAGLFFSCRVISWTPLKSNDQIISSKGDIESQTKTPSKPTAKKRATNQISSTKKAKPRIASKNAHLTKAHRDNTVDATISIGYFPKNPQRLNLTPQPQSARTKAMPAKTRSRQG